MPAEVARLEEALRELLALLSDPEAEGVPAAWQRCDEAGAALNRLLAESAPPEGAARAELRDGLDRLMRLNAIARQAVQRRQDGLAHELVGARRQQQQMKAYSAGRPQSGANCDLAG